MAIAGLVEWMIVGIVIGLVYKPAPSAVDARRRSMIDEHDARLRSPKRASKIPSRPRRRSAISTAIAACSRTAATTSTISRGTRRSKKSATCCGTAGCRRAPSSATCSRSSSAARPLPGAGPAADADAAAGQHDGRAADADLGARPLRSRRRRQLAAGQLSQGGPADRADQLAGRDDGPAERRAAARSSRIRCSATPRISSTCSPASGRAAWRRARSTSR